MNLWVKDRSKVEGTALSIFFLVTTALFAVGFMIVYLLLIFSENEYPGIIRPDEGTHSSTGEEKIKYENWLIKCACGHAGNLSVIDKMQNRYRIAVYAGTVSAIILIYVTIFTPFFLDGNRYAIILLNFLVIICAIMVFCYYLKNIELVESHSQAVRSGVKSLVALIVTAAVYSSFALLGFIVDLIELAQGYFSGVV